VTEASITGAGILFLGAAAAANDTWVRLHLLPYYCATRSWTLGLAHFVRALLAALGLVLVVVVRPRLGRRAATRSPRSAAMATGRSLLAIVLAVATADGIMRFLRARAAPPPPVAVDTAARPKKETTIEIRGHAVAYAFNADGLRTRTSDEAVDHSAPTVLFGGESLMLGYGIDYEDTIPVRVGQSVGLQVANLAVSRFGLDEIYTRIKDYLPRFEHPVAVVTMVVYNILFRLDEDWRPRLVLDATGNLVMTPAGEGFFYSSPLYRKFRDVYHSSEAAETARFLLREIDQMVRRAGAKPLFVFTQCAWDICRDGPPGHQWLREYLREGLGLDYVDVEYDRDLHQPGDFHPSAQALGPYYEAISGALRRMGVERAPAAP
jgi:hypothetical protein